MPTIRVSVGAPTNDPKAVALVRRVTGLTVASAAKRLAEGPTSPLMVADLFKGDHEDRARELRQLITGFSQLGLAPYLLCAGPWNSWEQVLQNPKQFEISPAAVIEMLDRPDQPFD